MRLALADNALYHPPGAILTPQHRFPQCFNGEKYGSQN
jgi:hypothetical protein